MDEKLNSFQLNSSSILDFNKIVASIKPDVATQSIDLELEETESKMAWKWISSIMKHGTGEVLELKMFDQTGNWIYTLEFHGVHPISHDFELKRSVTTMFGIDTPADPALHEVTALFDKLTVKEKNIELPLFDN